jgi:hypothetical protein
VETSGLNSCYSSWQTLLPLLLMLPLLLPLLPRLLPLLAAAGGGWQREAHGVIEGAASFQWHHRQ